MRAASGDREPAARSDLAVRSGVASRALMVGAVLVSVAAPLVPVVAGSRTVRPLAWALLGLIVVALGWACLDLWSWRRLPAAFAVRDDVFVAPTSRAFGLVVSFLVLAIGFIATFVTEYPPLSNGAGDVVAVIFLSVFAVVEVLFAGVLVAAGVRGRPRVELTPTELIVVDIIGVRMIPWRALNSASPLTVDRHIVTLDVTRADLVESRGLNAGSPRRPKFGVGSVRIHRTFLADAIRFYAVNAQDRAAIGTRGGHHRLISMLDG